MAHDQAASPVEAGAVGPSGPRARGLRSTVAGALLAGLVAVAIGALNFQVELNPSGDNVEYMLLARAMVEGKGFVQFNAPGLPPEAKRVPGYPLLLAACMLAVGQNLALLKATSLLLLGLAAGVAYYFFALQAGGSRLLVMAASALTVLNLGFVKYGSVTFSEMLFTVVGLLVLLALERGALQPRAWLPWAGLWALAIVSAIYVRPNGLALVPAAAFFLLVRRHWAAAVIVPVLCVGAVLPWFVREQHLARPQETYTYYALHRTDTSQTHRSLGAGDLVDRVAAHAAARFRQLGQLVVAAPGAPDPVDKPHSGMLGTGEGSGALPAAPPHKTPVQRLRRSSRYCLAALVIGGGLLLWRGGGSAAHWYALWTAVMLLVGPFQPARYLVPLLPIWNWFLVGGLWRMGRVGPSGWQRLARPATTVAIVALCVLSAALTGLGTASRLRHNLAQQGRPYDWPERYALEGEDFVRYVEAARWLREHAPANAVVIARKPYHVYYISGRRCVDTPLWSRPGAQMWQQITGYCRAGPVYLIEDAFGRRFAGEDLVTGNLLPTLREHRDQVRAVFVSSPPVTAIWQLSAPGGDTGMAPRSGAGEEPTRSAGGAQRRPAGGPGATLAAARGLDWPVATRTDGNPRNGGRELVGRGEHVCVLRGPVPRRQAVAVSDTRRGTGPRPTATVPGGEGSE